MTAIAAPSSPPAPDTPVMEGISWQTYQALVRELDAAGKHLRVTYDRGRMVVTSPAPIHEKWKEVIGRLVETLADERDIPLSAYGSTTWQREDLEQGIEPDECFYVQHAEGRRNKADIDLMNDPPPDLAIEIDYTRHPLNRMEVYAGLRIPEVWQYNGRRLRALRLTSTGYVEIESSDAFPGFRPIVLHQFLAMHPASLDGEIAKAFRAHLRSNAGKR